jgi:Flp pilus assembly protein TadG
MDENPANMFELPEITPTHAAGAACRRFLMTTMKRFSGRFPRFPGSLPMGKTFARLAKTSEGGALVEFAMVLPMMMVVVTGIFFLGIALTLYLQLTNATDIGARLLSVSRGQTTDPCNTASVAVKAAAPNLSASGLTFTYVLDGQSYSGTTCTAGAAYLVQGTSAQLKVTYPVHLGIYGLGWNTITLNAQTTELVQ